MNLLCSQIHSWSFFDVRAGACSSIMFNNDFSFLFRLFAVSIRVAPMFIYSFIVSLLIAVADHYGAPSDPKDPVSRLNARFKAALGVSKLDRFGHKVGACTVDHPVASSVGEYVLESRARCLGIGWVVFARAWFADG